MFASKQGSLCHLVMRLDRGKVCDDIHRIIGQKGVNRWVCLQAVECPHAGKTGHILVGDSDNFDTLMARHRRHVMVEHISAADDAYPHGFILNQTGRVHGLSRP